MFDELNEKDYSVTKLIHASFAMYKKQRKFFLLSGLLVFIPLNLVRLFVPLRRVTDEFLAGWTAITDPNEYMEYLSSAATGQFMQVSFILIGVMLLFLPLIFGAFSYICIQEVESKPVSFDGIMEHSLHKWLKLIYTVACFLFFSVPISILLAFIAPIIMLFFMITSCFALIIAAVTEKYGFSALLISRLLMYRKWFKGFLLLVLNGIILFFFDVILTVVMVLFNVTDNIVAVTMKNIIYDFSSSFAYISFCLFYINVCKIQSKRAQDILV